MSSAAVALALVLGLLPAGLLIVDGSVARADLGRVVAASAGVSVRRTGVADAGAFDAFQGQARGEVAPRLGRYLDGGSERAAAGPLRVNSINSRQPIAPLDTAQVTMVYVADLPARVQVTQGLLSRRGATGVEQTASMPQAVADRVGIRLFDQVCVGALPGGTAATSPWCTRIVGLWRPAGAADPQWTAANAPLQLFTERDELFALIGLGSVSSAEAARQYRPLATAIAPQDAATVAERVREVRASAAASRVGEVRTSLDADLERYVAATPAVSFPVGLLTAALIPLVLLLAGMLARWYVEPRLHDLALLRARGWSRARVRRLVLAQFAALGAPALGVALAGLLALAWLAGSGSIGGWPLSLSPLEWLGVALAAAIPVVGAVARIVETARWASRQSVLRLDHPEARPSRMVSWRGADLNGLLVLPAALLLLVARLAEAERWWFPRALGDVGPLLVSVAGLVLLTVAALPAMSRAAEARGSRGGEVEGTLAQWQLRRWWQRHAAAGFLMVFAFSIASFAAVALAQQEADRLERGAGALGQGVAGSLAAGFASSMAAALLAFGLVFLFACRSRVDDYTALLVDGLPAAAVGRSLAIEQRAVLVEGLLVGLGLGLLLAWVSSPAAGLEGTARAIETSLTPAAAGAGLLSMAVIGLGAGLAVARLVRRSAVGFRLVERGHRAT